MTIQHALISAIKKLRNKSITSAHLDAEVILSYILKKPKGYLLAHPEKKLSASQIKKFNFLMAQRQRGIPIPYLTHSKEFYGLDFFIDKRVMIPRPETELLIEEVVKYTRLIYHKLYAISHKPITIADIGTGSGCIAIALAKYLPKVKIYATDISEKALAVAKINAKRQKVLNRIKFLKGDLLTPLCKGRACSRPTTIDLLVANLPYLAQDELANVPHEPRQALDGGKLGLEIIEKLLVQASQLLKPTARIFLEISPNQTKALEYIIEQQMPDRKIVFKKDLAGRERVAVV